MKKIAATLFAGAAAAAMLAAPALAVPGEKINYNSPDYWSEFLGATCVMTSVADVDSWTADMDYAYVIVKGGSKDYGWGPGNMLYPDPEGQDNMVSVGDILRAPLNNGGQQAAISHLIVCTDGGGSGSGS